MSDYLDNIDKHLKHWLQEYGVLEQYEEQLKAGSITLPGSAGDHSISGDQVNQAAGLIGARGFASLFAGTDEAPKFQQQFEARGGNALGAAAAQTAPSPQTKEATGQSVSDDSHYRDNIKSQLNKELQREGILDDFNQQLADNGAITFTKSDGTQVQLSEEQALDAANVLGARGLAQAIGGNADRIATLEKYSGQTVAGKYNYTLTSAQNVEQTVETSIEDQQAIDDQIEIEAQAISDIQQVMQNAQGRNHSHGTMDNLSDDLRQQIEGVKANMEQVITEAENTNLATDNTVLVKDNELKDLGTTPPENTAVDLDDLLNGQSAPTEAKETEQVDLDDLLNGQSAPAETKETEQVDLDDLLNGQSAPTESKEAEQADLDDLLNGQTPPEPQQETTTEAQSTSATTPETEQTTAETVGEPAADTQEVPAATVTENDITQNTSFKQALETMTANKDFKSRHFKRAEETAQQMGADNFLQAVQAGPNGIEWANKEKFTSQEKEARDGQDKLINKARETGKKHGDEIMNDAKQKAKDALGDKLGGLFGSVEGVEATDIANTVPNFSGPSDRGIV